MATFLETFGDGSDGAYSGGNLTGQDEYNFTSFTLDESVNFAATNGNKLVIRVQGDLTLGASAAITSPLQNSKDSATISIAGSSYSVASTDGADGSGGSGGAGGSGINLSGYSGGNGGAVDTHGDPGINGQYSGTGFPGPALGGSAGVAPGGDGGDGENGYNDMTNSSAGGSGGGGAGGALPQYQNGIAFIVGGDVTLDGTITGNGDNGGAGGDGGQGGGGINFGSYGGGGGGGGGAGAGGSGGVVVKFFSIKTPTGSISLTATGGSGDEGGNGGFNHPNNPCGAEDGENGTAGAAGTAGSIANESIATTPPGITSSAVEQIFATTCSASANVISDGGDTITERGFVWDTSSSPTTSDNKETVSGTTGTMTKTITGLDAATTIYVRPFATNSIGTEYGDEVSFKTQPSFLPLITTGG